MIQARPTRRSAFFLARAAVASAAAVAMSGGASAAPLATADAGASEASGASGGASMSDSVSTQLRRMQDELDRLRKDNEAMKGQIDELHARTEDNWLTEARAEQIRGLVQDVLADADMRASLLDSGMTAGWSEHFFLASPDGKFKLQIEGAEQIRWIMNFHDLPRSASLSGADVNQYRSGFENTRTRLTFSGHVFSPDIEYLVRTDFFSARNGFAQLLDSWIRYNFDNHWSMKVGQFKLPFNREYLVSEMTQLTVEQSLVSQFTNLGRSQGIQFDYHDELNSFSVAYSDGATAAFLANPNLQANNQQNNQINSRWSLPGTDYAFAGRYERLLAGSWDQFADFTSPRGQEFGMLLGFAAQLQRGESNNAITAGKDEQGSFGETVDLSVEWGGANAFVAFTHQYVDNPAQPSPFITDPLGSASNTYGIVAQAGLYVAPKWEVFLRDEFAWVDSDAPVENLHVVTFGWNYYIQGHDVKWTTDFGFSLNEVDPRFANDVAGWRSDVTSGGRTDFQFVIRTQFQLLF